MYTVEVRVYLDDNLYSIVSMGTYPYYHTAQETADRETISFYPYELVHTVGIVNSVSLVGSTPLQPIYYGIARPRLYS